DLEEMERRRRTHADVVLLVSGGGDGVDRGWMRERLQLVDKGRGRVLPDHQSALHAGMLREKWGQTRVVAIGQARGPPFGDRGQLGHGSLCVVEGERQRLPVEVASRDDLAVRMLPGRREDERVV